MYAFKHTETYSVYILTESSISNMQKITKRIINVKPVLVNTCPSNTTFVY